MDDRTGVIYTSEVMAEKQKRLAEMFDVIKAAEQRKHFREMLLPPTEKQLGRVPPRVGRNEPCPCGSGKKFKHCCLAIESVKEQEK